MIKTKLVSSLDKVLLTTPIDSLVPFNKMSALKGEQISVQLIYQFEHDPVTCGWDRNKVNAEFRLEGSLAPYATARVVRNVPVIFSPFTLVTPNDHNFISKEPGLYPDVLTPMRSNGTVTVYNTIPTSIWIEVKIPEDMPAGEATLTMTLDGEAKGYASETLTVDVIDAVLPENSLYMTQWFHCDSLAHYYNVEVWSERHWQIIENYARVAVKNGINLLLTPTFTPPLDTQEGGERLTTQLVGVTKTSDKYEFDFTLLDRWVDMCDRIGIKYFEIAHFFTQWGAGYAPKVMATVDGEYKKIFGWETPATGPEYSSFLRQFVVEFLDHMKKNGNDKRCLFHISDEPSVQHLEQYQASKAVVADLLSDYIIMDALSKYDFYANGVCETPIPANNHIAEFIENKVPNLWTYYCCSQMVNVSNRFIQMPSCRNRSIGYQMFKYDIVGFLHWGYNFYQNCYSINSVNPFLEQDGDAWVSAGDAFSVYPAQDGTPLESLRIIVFYEALQDISAMKLCASLVGKDAVVKLIDEALGKDVTFDDCAKDRDTVLCLREKVNALIKESLAK